MVKRIQDMEVDQNLEFQKKEWAVERIGWVGMGLILLLALLGLFGDGPLSRVRVNAGGATELEYQRFMRDGSEDVLLVRTLPGPDGKVVVELERAYLQRYKVNQVQPEPESVQVGNGVMRFVFRAYGSEPVTIIYHLTPLKVGSARTLLGVNGERITVNQFVYP